jgi:hypothetical protein
MHFKEIILGLLISLVLSACYKDNVDIATLNTNPWDLDFNGGDVLRVDSAYFDSIYSKRYITQYDSVLDTMIIIDSVETTYYVNKIKISVKNSLFDDNLSDSYNLWVEQPSGFREVISQDSIDGPHVFWYEKNTFTSGQELCYLFAISRNESRSKGINFCNTNPF